MRKGNRAQKCPGIKRSHVIMGMLRPAAGGQPAVRAGAATVALALHVTHHHRATSSVTSCAATLFCILEKKKFEKCFAKYTFFLKIVPARRRKTQCQQDLDMATAHPCKWEADLSLFTHLTRTSLTYFLAYVLREQIHVTMHFEGIDRNINLFSLSEKNEHWQHMFTVFYCKKKKEKTTTPNFKYLFCRRPVLLWNNIALWTTNM